MIIRKVIFYVLFALVVLMSYGVALAGPECPPTEPPTEAPTETIPPPTEPPTETIPPTVTAYPDTPTPDPTATEKKPHRSRTVTPTVAAFVYPEELPQTGLGFAGSMILGVVFLGMAFLARLMRHGR